jgi:poly(3-hydroxybutyrate) depolymerase
MALSSTARHPRAESRRAWYAGNGEQETLTDDLAPTGDSYESAEAPPHRRLAGGSSKVKKDKKAPLIVTLHGIGGTHTTMMRPNAIDLAEADGYILLAPMGYNPRGWYGAPPPRGRRGG